MSLSNKHSDLQSVIETELEPISRRRFLRLGAGAFVATLASVQTGCAVLQPRGGLVQGVGLRHLSRQEYLLFRNLRDGLLQTKAHGLPPAYELPVLENVDQMVGRLPNGSRYDLGLAVKLFDYSALVMTFSARTAAHMHPDELQVYSERWQQGTFLQRGIMTTLKSALYLAYWREPATWQALDYDGPVTEDRGIRRLGNAPLPGPSTLSS